LVLYPTSSINLGFTTEGRLVAILIITFSWGFPTGQLSTIFIHQHHTTNKFSGAVAREKQDFCKGSLLLPTFYFVIVLLYFIFACIFLSKLQKKLVPL
jgi:hypothetical protein